MMTKNEVSAVFGMLNEMLDRLTRTETRLVNVMKQLGLDPYTGKPMEKRDEVGK